MTLEQAGTDESRRWLPAAEVDWDAAYADQLPRIYNYFRFRLGQDADVEDLTSRTFEKAWSARERELIALKYGVADGTYSLARPVYIYTNSNRARFDRTSVGARFFWELVDRASPSWGYLSRSGLTPITESELEAQFERQQIPMRGMAARP